MKKNKRNQTKYPGLTRQLCLKIREELIDQDYIDKLSKEEKEWLNQFNEEWVNAKIYSSKDGRYNPKFHTGKKDRKKIGDMNNSRNRDAFGNAKVSGKLDPITNNNSSKRAYNPENGLIEKIDSETEIVKIYEKLMRDKK